MNPPTNSVRTMKYAVSNETSSPRSTVAMNAATTHTPNTTGKGSGLISICFIEMYAAGLNITMA